MPDLWNDLLACLELRADASADLPDSDTPATSAVFEGTNQQLEYHRLFGGQLLGQFVRAAEAACPTKRIKSLHALFPREGKASEPVRYEVTRQHEGRSFATLSIVASQSSGVIGTASVSMHVGEDGPELQTVESVPPVLGENDRARVDLIPWEIRTTEDLNSYESSPPEYEMWMRTPEVDPALAPALTAYATDLTLIGTALRPLEGLAQTGNGTVFTSAVTSHTLWFHRPFRTDEWLLVRQHSPLIAHGRCFGRGDVLDEKGTLVASFAQEALLRLPRP
ncbi:acyl-CoA thioesterase [Rhodococcus sp. NPDC003382]|uniref:acyl-CoA thioesterase n=1 Tax=unclassified Rhodococcus (in: high G+C Gram-positive bacteria) TaxID=192944 RepID=UPI0018CE34E7|nr:MULTISPECIES: acyl-CoA thioesterase domain-containing protein [unclassified Rhodococcus (in: high G+C Gram-positive bacteria)]MBH0123498.1 thioesterase family protein [Rhodococcus sp. CX]MCK8670422.1 thioesterase family protein [Rhodococcus sp. HM1]